MAEEITVATLSKKLDAIKSDVEDRVDKAKGEDGKPTNELFRKNNPDIEMSMGKFVKEQYDVALKLQDQIDEIEGGKDALNNFQSLVELGKERNKGIQHQVDEAQRNDLTKAIWDSEEFKEMKAAGAKSMSMESDMSLKELFGSDSNTVDRVNIESVRDGDYVPLARTRVTLLDIIPQVPTTERVVKYDEEVKNLSAVGPIAEGAAYAESEFQINEATANVVKVGCYLQISEELLEDAPEMRARIDGNLDGQMMRRIQSDIIGGTPLPAAEYVGNPANNASITGFLDLTDDTGIGAIDANAGLAAGEKGNSHSVIEQAVEEVYRNGMADADGIVMTSQDWVEYVTLQATTGNFIARGAMEGTQTALRMQINGLPVIMCNALPKGTVLVGDFGNYAVIRDRRQVQVRIQEAFNVPVGAANTAVQTQPAGRYNIFTDARFAFYVRRGLAFCKITDYGVAAS